ncbi:glycosyltransferase family 2 protein [Auraticoccus monumenti]|uniref:glycosyltransferase family 2 protein n=1 Tax=Auraticoccus monumenti TaxID=675864 RepID=UPI000B81B6F5|nr:glycosyltransferase family 2 protein [Auraticoccus monumenti]
MAIVVVNYGASAMVEGNLLRTVGDGFAGSVVVVDNFSSDAERQAVTEVCSRNTWLLVPSEVNSGYGGGNNLGVRAAIAAGATEVLLLNPDAHIGTDDLARLQQRVRQQPMTLLAPLVVRPDGRVYSASTDLHLRTGEMLATRRRPGGVRDSDVHVWVSGACMMLSTRLWSHVGGFDEAYFLYWEDVDLCRRVVLAGGDVAVDESCTAVHDEGGTHGFEGPSRAKSPIYYYYNVRNRMLYARLHLPARDRRRWALRAPLVAYRILLQGGRRQLVHPGRTVWPALRGVVHGWALLRSRG